MQALTDEDGNLAVRLARAELEKRIGGSKEAFPNLTPVFSQKRGVFVTLTRLGELRGCIGFPYPHLPLEEAIRDAAVSAALQDPRFPPVNARELPLVHIEVTILTVPETMKEEPEARPVAVEVGRHGLIVQGRGQSGLLLPQVPVEWGWNSREFLDHTCMKAGLPPGCWKSREVEILTFEGQIFHEG
jgi:uncharacterized protein (TIGR00296 family)